MSRGCYKAYGRKINGPGPHPSIQFDKVFCENSNKPTASKSTGTVGKWGITSFTSIRSSSLICSYKRPRETKPLKEPSVSPTLNDIPNSVAAPESPSLPKPKKFFKSRNVPDEVPAQTKPAKSHHYHHHHQTSQKSPKPPPSPPPAQKQFVKTTNRPVRQASIAAAKKLVDAPDPDFEDYDDLYPTEPENLARELPIIRGEMETDSKEAPSSPQHPPIVLRIFKGTAQLLTDGVVGSPTSEVPEVRIPKKDRRRSHGSDSSDSVSPKRHKNKYKDHDPPPAVEVIQSTALSPSAALPTVKDEEEDDEKVAEMEKCLQEAQTLLADTENIDLAIDRLSKVEKKSVVTEEDRAQLLRVLEDESSSHSAGPEPSSPPAIKNKTEDDEMMNQVKNEVVDEDDKQIDPSSLESERQGEWVTAEYHPPPEIKTRDPNTEAKVEPLVLRRPAATSKPIKKGSIFKSRNATGEKRNARYIHNWSDQKDEAAKLNEKTQSKPSVGLDDGEFDSEILTRVTNYPEGEKESEDCNAVTSVTCSKKAKEFYTVVRNVKKAHQIQESGEFQEFNDDVEYILDALKDNNPISTRCLSAITLASKCMVPAFRMHVRAHGTVTKFFRALHDATKDQRLGMCTATVMFVLSQDRLNMDVDRDSLELMLSLLESDASHSSALEGCGLSDSELRKTKDRVRSLCEEIQEQGHARHLNLDNITVGQLAMETLLSLTSRRAGEWFKEELRDLGGLEHIIKTVVETCRPVDHHINEWTPQLMDRLRKADRCLKVLENVTFQNEENNNYLLTYGDGVLVDAIVRVYHVCDRQLVYYPTIDSSDKDSVGAVIRECLIANLKVLINLTHDYDNKSFGSTLAGKREGILEASLHVLLVVPNYVPEKQKFDIIVLGLILLINLVEHSETNRKLLVEAKAPSNVGVMFEEESSAVGAFVKMFLEQEELARTEERKTDAILDGEEKPEAKEEKKKSNEEFIEETVQLLLQKAGRHMEHTFVAAYIALLLGYITIDNEEFELYVRDNLPNKDYTLMLAVLQKFYNFMTLTVSAGSGSSRGIKATEELIKHLTDVNNEIHGETKPLPT